MVTDTSENLPVKGPKPNTIAKFCREYELLDSHKNRNFLLTTFYILYLSYLISLAIPKSTWSWLALFFGLLICFIGSDMISIGPGKLGSIVVSGFDSAIMVGNIHASDEIKYGNEILRIGFACQLLGLILSLISR